MGYLEAILLGILQGITEFLPVSSSGHLVLGQFFLGVTQPGVTFEVMVHFGTMMSVVWVFWDDLRGLIKGFLNTGEERRFLILLMAGMVPTGLMGVFLASYFKRVFEKPLVVGIMLLVTGLIVWLINNIKIRHKDIISMNILDALVIGFFQGIAIIPGISRSGSTILGALLRGLNRETAVRYSFLLSLPAIAGATFIEFLEWRSTGAVLEHVFAYALATVTAFVAGIFAIKIFIELLKKGKFCYFSYYCWLMGFVTIIFKIF